jgi:hypothetical protein
VEVFADAIAAEPNFIESRSLNPDFVAACASCALALCHGSSALPDLSEQDRARFRSMACRWLNDELAMQMHRERNKYSDSRAWLQRELAALKHDPGLASLKDPSILQTLTPEQRDESAAFWQALDDALARLKGSEETGSTAPPPPSAAHRS